MSFIRCGDHTHWGPYGVSGLFLTTPGHRRVLLQLRSAYVLNPGLWALPGGALERSESVQEAAMREAEEEVGLDRRTLTLIGTRPGLTHPRWSYTYVLAETPDEALPPHESWRPRGTGGSTSRTCLTCTRPWPTTGLGWSPRWTEGGTRTRERPPTPRPSRTSGLSGPTLRS